MSPQTQATGNTSTTNTPAPIDESKADDSEGYEETVEEQSNANDEDQLAVDLQQRTQNPKEYLDE